MADPLLHMTTTAAWAEVVPGGELRPVSLAEQGFVHLSTPEQVHLPANRLYAGSTDLVLLCLDPARIEPEVRWEPGASTDPSSMLFPHLYGPLDSDSVIAVLPYRPGADGTFAPPTDLPKF
jgi:uncharacterized protein (DUF952 family)